MGNFRDLGAGIVVSLSIASSIAACGDDGGTGGIGGESATTAVGPSSSRSASGSQTSASVASSATTTGQASSSTSGAASTTATTSAATTATTSAVSTTAAASSSSGIMGDGNDTFATAEPLVDQGGFWDTGLTPLSPPDTDVDYFSFVADGPVFIDTACKPVGTFDETYPDLVVSVYDAQQNLVARNDDPYPRSRQDPQLLTVLPGAGTYYVRVDEYCALFGGCAADYFDPIVNLDYQLTIFPLDPVNLGVMDEAVEPNDTAATATDVEYSSTQAGVYATSIGWSDLSDAADVDGWSFTVPSDLALGVGQRASATFTLPPAGTSESGSSAVPGVVEVIDPVSSGVIARLDLTNGGVGAARPAITLPVSPGTPLFLRVARGGTVIGSTPFSFLLHNVGGGNPVEAFDATNGLFAGAEVLTVFPGTTSFFVEGDLGDTDQDHYRLAVQPGLFAVSCVAQRAGSGIRGLTATVLRGTDATVLSSGSETATDDLSVIDADTTGQTQIVVRLTKTSQAVDVSGTYYRCGFHFQ